MSDLIWYIYERVLIYDVKIKHIESNIKPKYSDIYFFRDGKPHTSVTVLEASTIKQFLKEYLI